MQPARELVGSVRFSLRKLGAGVKLREYQLNRRNFFFRVETDRDTATVVDDAHRAVAMHGYLDAVRVLAKRFVRRVVDRFLDDVGGIGRPGIHPRQALHGLDAAQLLD